MNFDIQTLAVELSKHIQPSGSWPRWLKLKQAAAYSSWGEKKLIELATSRPPKIRGFQDTELSTQPWTFDRDSIDEYRMKQAMLSDTTPEESGMADKALAILNSVRL